MNPIWTLRRRPFRNLLPTAVSPNGITKVGDFVAKDDLLVDIETDKVVIEVYAPTDGVLTLF